MRRIQNSDFDSEFFGNSDSPQESVEEEDLSRDSVHGEMENFAAMIQGQNVDMDFIPNDMIEEEDDEDFEYEEPVAPQKGRSFPERKEPSYEEEEDEQEFRRRKYLEDMLPEKGAFGEEELEEEEKSSSRRRGRGAKKEKKSAAKEKPSKKEKRSGGGFPFFSKKEKPEKKEKPPKVHRGREESFEEEKDYEDLPPKKGFFSKKPAKKGPEKVSKKPSFGEPKILVDPTDMEIHDGKPEYFYNVEKTLRKNGLGFIANNEAILDFLDGITYDNQIFDNYAVKQHDYVEKYNSMTRGEQRRHDFMRLVKRIAFALLVIGGIASYQILVVVPRNNYATAYNLLLAGNYKEAYTSFADLRGYQNSKYFAKYCEGKELQNAKKYDEAKEAFKLLLPYQEVFPKEIFIEDEIRNSDYLKAVDLYGNGKLEEAATIFRENQKYKDSLDFYYKIHYKIASDHFENGEYEEAMAYFANVLDYEDAQKRYDDLGEQFYKVAKEQYDKGDYEDARGNFEYLAGLKYKNSEEMFTQCSYRYGINLYEQGSYIKTIQILSDIQRYKDAFSVMKDSQYRYAKNLYNSNPIKSISEFEKIKGYKDVDKYLNSLKLILYGTWKVDMINDTKVRNLEFTFTEGNQFFAKKELANIALSTEASSRAYKWKPEYMEFENYRIIVTPDDYNHIRLTAQNGKKRTTYLCTRILSYSEMVREQEIADGTVEGTDFEIALKTYILSKKDRKLSVRGKTYDIDNFSAPEETKDTSEEETEEKEDLIENEGDKKKEEEENPSDSEDLSAQEEEELEKDKKGLRIFEGTSEEETTEEEPSKKKDKKKKEEEQESSKKEEDLNERVIGEEGSPEESSEETPSEEESSNEESEPKE